MKAFFRMLSPAILRPNLAALLVATGALAATSCTGDPVVEVEYAPYDGEAFPDQVLPVAWPAGPAGLVTDAYGDTLSVIDMASGARVDVRPVGRSPVDLDGPHHVAVDPVGRRAFVALSYPVVGAAGPHASHGASTATGWVQRLDLDKLVPAGVVRVDANPGDIVISADGSRVVVSHFDLKRAVANPDDLEKARATIAVIPADGVRPTGSDPPTFIKTCVAPHGVLLSPPSGETAFVACYGEDSLSIVDTTNPSAPVVRVPVGAGVSGFGDPQYGPYALTMSPDGELIAISNTVSKDVRFYGVDEGAMEDAKTIDVQGAPYFSAFDAPDRLVIPTQQPDQLVVADLTGQTAPVTRAFTPEECVLPHQVVRADDGTFWVVCEGDKVLPGSILHLSAALEVLSTAAVGVYPDSFVIVPPVTP